MFLVLDHADVVYTGELSQATQYVIEHYGNQLDEGIRSGVRILYADPSSHSPLNPRGDAIYDADVRSFRDPVDDWEID